MSDLQQQQHTNSNDKEVTPLNAVPFPLSYSSHTHTR